MGLTLADIGKWNPAAIRAVARAVTKLGTSSQEVSDGLKQLPIIATWEGQGGTAARESLGSLGMFLTNHSEETETVSKGLLKSADDVEDVRGDLSNLYTKADNWHFNIDPETGTVSATNATDEAAADAHKTELEGDIRNLLEKANGVDQELGSALSSANGMHPVNADHTPGSLPLTIDTVNTPPPPGERFSAAERYIYDEIVRNRNSETVKDLHGRLTPPISAFDAYIAARDWRNKVQAGGPWDHKPKLEKLLGIESPDKLDPNHYFLEPGTNREVLYDIYSNIHYGYIGREAGFPTDTLIWGSSLNTAATGTNDAGDIIAMRGGAALYEKYGPNMTAAQFHTGLIDIVNQLDAAKRAGQDVPQIRYLP